jgi:ectoine hydroxylase-related dioxygenase (phytanoyl-CoA dioxygenase family)
VREWRDALDDEGWVVVRSLLDRPAIEELRAAFPAATPGSTLHVELDDATPHRARWEGLVHQPAVAALLADRLGAHEVYVHGRDPGRGAGAQGLHADRPAGRMFEVDAYTLIWMLDDFSTGNGATRVVPRSHRGAAAVPRHLAQPGLRHPDEIVVTGEAGDVLIFDAHLWHSGRRNDDGARRRAVQMAVTRTALVGSHQ